MIMKIVYLIGMMIGLHISFIVNPVQAQTTQNKLNQVELWGYDKKNDKIIFATIWESSPEISIWAYWFTSKNTCEAVSYQDISNRGKAVQKYKMEIKSTDSYILRMLQNNKPVAELTFNRVKKS
jgi:hypothetical protein